MTQTKDRLASLSALRGHLLLMIWAALAVGLLGIALTVRPALAAPSPIAPQAQANDPEENGEEEEEEEVWEEVEGEDDGGWVQIYDEEEADLEAGNASETPTECPLGTVKPKAILERDRGKLRLVLHYATDSPTQVGVDFWLRGGKDEMQRGLAKRRLNRTGVLRLGRHLNSQAQSKTRDGHVVIVQLKAPAAPPHCPSQVTKRLTVGQDVSAASSAGLERSREL